MTCQIDLLCVPQMARTGCLEADHNGGYERGLRAHCQLRSVSEAAADLVLAPSTGVADGWQEPP
jgi:hypothetical protein